MKTFFISMCCVLTLVVQGAETITIVSSAAQAGATGGGGSFQPVVKGAGRYVAFVSQANNLATNDNATPHLDVFLRDRTAGVTVLVSVNSYGLGGGDDNSVGPALSADGRFVAFQSGAANLAGTDTNGASDVFLRDLLAGTTVLASHIPGSPASGNRASFGPLLSSSGNVVVYESGATNLVANDTNTTPDIFIYDRLTGTNALVSVNGAGNGSRAGTNLAPSITPDGRLVAYANFTGGPIPFPRPVRGHIFVRDMLAGTTTWASSNAMTGLPDYVGASGPALSSDGRFVFFHAYNSITTNLYRFDLLAGSNALVSAGTLARSLPSPSETGRYVAYEKTNLVYVWDGDTGMDAAASVTQSGSPAPSRDALARPVLSLAGDKVFFLSDAGDLTANPTNTLPQLYLRDLALGTNFLLSADTNGAAAGDLGAVVPSVSEDGAVVAFESAAGTLVADDLNLASDVFMRDVTGGATAAVSMRDMGLPSLTAPALATLYPNSVSANSRYVAYASLDAYLFPGDTNGVRDIFVRDLVTGAVEPASVSSTGAFTNSASGGNPVLSANGRRVAYVAVSPTSIVLNKSAAFWRDLNTGETRAVSEPPLPAGPVPWEQSRSPSISPDGRWVAFETTRSINNYGIGISDVNGAASDILLHDTAAGTNVLISRSVVQPNQTANAPSSSPLFSPDGRWLAFVSAAINLTTNSPFGPTNLFVRDLAANVTHAVTFGSIRYISGAIFSGDSRFLVFTTDGSVPVGSVPERILVHALATRVATELCAGCRKPAVSADGRFVAAENRTAAYLSGTPLGVFLHDRLTGTSNLISGDMMYPFNYNGNGNSDSATTGGDGRFTVFVSKATRIDPADTSPQPTLYVHDRLRVRTTALPVGLGGSLGNGSSFQPTLAADGRTLVFTSFASDLVSGDYNDRRDVFTLRLGSADIDGDGLDDDWEVTFFGNLARDGTGDFDLDGQSDRAEFVADTDPTNTGSVLRVTTLFGVSSSGATVIWNSAANRTYLVQFKDALGSGWSTLAGPVRGTGFSVSKVDNSQPRPPGRFYRVVLP